jgi:hypothetical protein
MHTVILLKWNIICIYSTQVTKIFSVKYSMPGMRNNNWGVHKICLIQSGQKIETWQIKLVSCYMNYRVQNLHKALFFPIYYHISFCHIFVPSAFHKKTAQYTIYNTFFNYNTNLEQT